MTDHKDGSAKRVSSQWNRTLRLTFSYEGSNVRLVSSQSIDMKPPPAEPEPIQKGQSGFWYELTDAHGRQLYQRVVHNPIRMEDEIYSSEPNAPILGRRLPTLAAHLNCSCPMCLVPTRWSYSAAHWGPRGQVRPPSGGSWLVSN